jgi:type VI protein secretion system component VasK
MDSTLLVVAVVLCVTWGVWWWLMRGNLDRTAALTRRVEELEKRHESP